MKEKKETSKKIPKTISEEIVYLKPLVTEKAVMAIERENSITFEVDKRKSKTEISKEIENIFDVKVEKIRTSTRGREKHAYVKLKKEFLAIDLATKLGII